LPFSYAAILIGSLALTGFPFLAGFYSKDVILELAYAKSTSYSLFAYFLGVFAAFCTSYYSTRLLILVFLVKPNGNRKSILGAHEGTWNLTLPLFLLSILSVVVGYTTKEFFIGFGTDFWGNAIFILPQNYTIMDIEFISLFYKLLPLIVTILGALSAVYLYSFGIDDYFQLKKTKMFKYIYLFLNRKWYFDKIINDYIASPVLFVGHTYTYKDVDRGLVEKFGPWGITTSIKFYVKSFRLVQTGYIYNYLLLIIFSFYLILSVYFLSSFIIVPLSLLLFFLIILFFFSEEI
jgi:NADH-ubiquinone oxidoreductase chain 5